ncbi:hypothetical protein [Desulforhopalus singaporensis]|uniref:Uncharacterized protein n=1 Tax=Desulforhopalus singaporensis TaxID=91360 RepID=A0A1H0VHY1_9BACT|nr:hypothetical protein [Desulforhopalus singaporensis]SDP78060.1 hypothetical protein SAMN05660330_04082 [Desulforhopalus singaporensis]
MKKLKPNYPAFEVVDGPFKGHVYRHGQEYAPEQIPPRERKKFEPVRKATAKAENKS